MRVGPRWIFTLLLALGWECFPAPAAGGIISQTQELLPLAPSFTFVPSYAYTNWNYTSPNQGGSPYGAFQQFNGGVGTSLVDVKITFTVMVESDITLTFANASTLSETVSGINANLHLPNGSTISVPFTTISQTDTETGPGSKTFKKTEMGSATMTITDPQTLAFFKGSGTIFLPIDSSATSSFHTSSGNGFGQAQTQVGVIVGIQFDFTPEPSSLALAGIGGAGLVCYRVFRRRRESPQADPIDTKS